MNGKVTGNRNHPSAILKSKLCSRRGIEIQISKDHRISMMMRRMTVVMMMVTGRIMRSMTMKMRRMRRSKFSARLSKEEVLNTWELSLQSIPQVQTCSIYTLLYLYLYFCISIIIFVYLGICVCIFVSLYKTHWS